VDVSTSNTVAPSPVSGSGSCDLHSTKCITSPQNGNLGSPNTINTSEILRAEFPKGEWSPDLDRQVERPWRAAPRRPREVLKIPNLAMTIDNGEIIKPRWSPLSTSVEFIDSRGTCGLEGTQTGDSMKNLGGPCTAASAEPMVERDLDMVKSADEKHSANCRSSSWHVSKPGIF
jgi:hypothetical protein